MCRTHAGIYRDGKRLCGTCWLKADEAQAAIAKEQAAEAERQRQEEREARRQRALSEFARKKQAEAERQRQEERQAWRQRVLGDLAGAEPVERLLRVVGRFCTCRYGNPRRTEVDVAAINELLGSPAWTVTQVTEWFRRRVTGSPPDEIETFRKTLSGKDRYSTIAAWTFREASDVERSVYDSMVFDSIAIAKNGHVFTRTEYSTNYWSPLEARREDKNLNFSYYGLLLVFEASGLQPVEHPAWRGEPQSEQSG